jgi:hypothetical protein
MPKQSKAIHRRVEIMLSNVSTSVLLSGWAALLALLIGISISVGATPSTVVLLLALGVAPGIVIFLLAHKTPSKSVAEILHSVDAKDGR